jgi:hypothetical protein
MHDGGYLASQRRDRGARGGGAPAGVTGEDLREQRRGAADSCEENTDRSMSGTTALRCGYGSFGGYGPRPTSDLGAHGGGHSAAQPCDQAAASGSDDPAVAPDASQMEGNTESCRGYGERSRSPAAKRCRLDPASTYSGTVSCVAESAYYVKLVDFDVVGRVQITPSSRPFVRAVIKPGVAVKVTVVSAADGAEEFLLEELSAYPAGMCTTTHGKRLLCLVVCNYQRAILNFVIGATDQSLLGINELLRLDPSTSPHGAAPADVELVTFKAGDEVVQPVGGAVRIPLWLKGEHPRHLGVYADNAPRPVVDYSLPVAGNVFHKRWSGVQASSRIGKAFDSINELHILLVGPSGMCSVTGRGTQHCSRLNQLVLILIRRVWQDVCLLHGRSQALRHTPPVPGGGGVQATQRLSPGSR